MGTLPGGPATIQALPGLDGLPRPAEVAAQLAAAQAEAEGYRPVVEIVEVHPGHGQPGPDGVCPTCGRIWHRSTAFDRDAWIARRQQACFEVCPWVVTVAYACTDPECCGVPGAVHHAMYGVPAEGPPSCWQS